MSERAILDRYVLREFAVYSLLTLLFFVGVFSIVDVFEKLDRFLNARAGIAELAPYVALNVPAVLVLVMPMALLLAALLVLSQMARFNELTAMNVAGLSLFRIARPMLAVALLASVLSFTLEEYVVPRTNSARQDFMDRRIARIRVSPPTQKDNLIYMGGGGRVFLVRTYDIPGKRMVEPTLQEFSGGLLRRRTDAREAHWDGRRWIMTEGVLRTFNGDQESAMRFATLALPGVRETPEDFAAEDRSPAELPMSGLLRYIHKLAESGRPTERYWVEYHLKLSYPLINVVALLLSVGIVAQVRRSSAALAFGLSALVSFTFYGLVATCRALGEAGTVAPWLAAWIGHVTFASLAAWMIWKSPR